MLGRKGDPQEHLASRYSCCNCGHWVEINAEKCVSCGHVFSSVDKNLMARKYTQNSKANWHQLVYLALFIAVVLFVFLGL